MNAPRRSRSKKVVKILSIPAALLTGYLLIGNLFHRVIFPMPAPDPATYPKVGDVFGSGSEVLKIEDDWVYLRLVMGPHAKGPAKHVHEGFGEHFTVKEGTLTVWVDGKEMDLGPGESYFVPAGTPHKPFNKTDQTVVIAGDKPTMPLSFAACLVQLYKILEETNGLAMGLQMSVIDPICDTQVHGMPNLRSGFLGWLMAPAARMAGYRNYYPEKALHPPGSTAMASPR